MAIPHLAELKFCKIEFSIAMAIYVDFEFINHTLQIFEVPFKQSFQKYSSLWIFLISIRGVAKQQCDLQQRF